MGELVGLRDSDSFLQGESELMTADDCSNTPHQATALHRAALQLGALLLSQPEEKVVLAESCTAGLVAATLARVPGISQSLCGSLVTYREASKMAWLGVEPGLLREHTAVSEQVTAAMVLGALARTPEATWSAAVTGHLGPGAPPELDGQIFIAVARRQMCASEPSPAAPTGKLVLQSRRRLTTESRTDRQEQAAQWVLETLANTFSEGLGERPPQVN